MLQFGIDSKLDSWGEAMRVVKIQLIFLKGVNLPPLSPYSISFDVALQIKQKKCKQKSLQSQKKQQK